MKHVLKHIKIALLICSMISSLTMLGQVTTKDSTRTVQLWSLSTGGHIPLFDLAKRYTPFAMISVDYAKKNTDGWLYGASFDAMYGTSVKNSEDIFGGLSDESGNFMGVNGEFAIIQPGLSGAQVLVNTGKLLKSHYNPNSGWVFMQGIGVTQSKIGLRNQRNNLPQLESPFLEGYDRLHRGLVTKTTLRYMHLDHNERVNYAFNLLLNMGLTRSVRGFNIDTGLLDDNYKFEAAVGASFTWFLPIYAKQESFYLID